MSTHKANRMPWAAYVLSAAWLVASCVNLVAAEVPSPVEVEKLLPKYVGAAVLAIEDGHTIFKYAWGRRCVDHVQICTPATNYRLASVSKHFTATAILRLVDQGKIRLADPIAKYFTQCPAFWRQVTVHQLLTHTSGLPDYEKLIPAGTELQLTDQQVLALLLQADEPLFEPGSRFAYSNSGYALLGLIVERASGCTFQDYLRAQVFGPAGMRRSVMYVARVNHVEERAFGHELTDDGRWEVADQSLTSAVRGDGGVYSSLNDLELWLKKLDRDLILSPASYHAMHTPHVKTDRDNDSYGYGWFLGDYRGERRVMHAGSTRGFSLMLQRFPERRAAIVILLNRGGDDESNAAVQRIVDALLFRDAVAQHH